ncbi:MAG: hypothetical protein JXQ85_13940 [Cognatishimia sp.]|uniref:hypothetical protein n=1 Tax=Cognatishimia sp. TaxID=2211648 RepID=UPI003B8DF631
MSNIHFETFETDTSRGRAELTNLALLLLQRTSVELILESKTNKKLSGDQFKVASSLLLSAVATGTLIPELLKERSVRTPSAFPLARMYYERLLNASYILADEGDASKRSILYSAYRFLKDQKKHFTIGGIRHLNSGGYKTNRESPLIKDAVKYFEKSGNSKTEIELDREGRIKAIGCVSKRSSVLFSTVEQSGHSIASEIVHGSFHSTNLFKTKFDPIIPSRDMDEASAQILIIFIFSSEALGNLLSNLFPNLENPKILSQIGKHFLELELPEFKDQISEAYGGI